jgi:hypothetical protein
VRRAGEGSRPDDARGGRPGAAPRIRFGSVNLFIEGTQAVVDVRLMIGERSLGGSAAGTAAALATERLVVAATLAALERVVRDDVHLLPGDLCISRLGTGEALLLEVVLVEGRRERRLVGASRIGTERHRAAVFATLAAVNRVIACLLPPRWMEIVVESRPSGVGCEELP